MQILVASFVVTAFLGYLIWQSFRLHEEVVALKGEQRFYQRKLNTILDGITSNTVSLHRDMKTSHTHQDDVIEQLTALREVADEISENVSKRNHMTADEFEREQKHNEFDERIQRAQREVIAYQQKQQKQSGVEAQEFHPDVQNLPHHTLNDYSEPTPPREVAE